MGKDFVMFLPLEIRFEGLGGMHSAWTLHRRFRNNKSILMRTVQLNDSMHGFYFGHDLLAE